MNEVYTIDQVELFLERARENERVEMLDYAVASRVAFGADKKGWKEYVDSMSPKKNIKKLPKADYDKLRRIQRRIHGGRN